MEMTDGSRRDDPLVRSGLAQAEALLAVAAAIDRLAEALCRLDESRLPAVRGSAEYDTEIRQQYSSAYMPWTTEADAALPAGHQAGHDV